MNRDADPTFKTLLIQEALKQRGLYLGALDNDWGVITEAAYGKFLDSVEEKEGSMEAGNATKVRTIKVFTSEGFTAAANAFSDGRIEIDKADGDIDADGANGQNGAKPAYMIGNAGTEHLGNGGMAMVKGRVIGVKSWFKDIVILGADRQPKVFPGGVIASKTAYRFPGKTADDPSAYVDSETVPYQVVQGDIIASTSEAVLGCYGRITNLANGKVVDAPVLDVGPRNKIGELSIAAARALGLPSSPRNGGTEKPILKYEIWPGRHGKIDGKEIALQRANGLYVLPT